MSDAQPGVLERLFQFSPVQFLIIGFAGLIAIGTVLLMLPMASSTGESLRPLDALFTATSAICVTGLIVLDTPVDFSLFGQAVILVLIQIGGLGYMTIGTVLLMVLGKRIGLQQRMVIQETLSTFTMEGLIRFIIGIVTFTFVMELLGAALLMTRFMDTMPPMRAAYFGLFHSISAFNNAGFALYSNSLANYRTDPVINGVIMVLIAVGGIGFLVLKDLTGIFGKKVHRLRLHTKVALIGTALLIVIGVAGFWLFENHFSAEFKSLPLSDQGMTALFQTVSVRTAGFNTINTGTLATPTQYLFVILMFIGGSPGSTAGGIKTTTFMIILLAIWSAMRGREDTTLFYRRISVDVIAKASFLAAMAMMLVSGVTLLLLFSEERNLLRTLFEVTSAAGTVGMSSGDGGSRSFCSLFSDFGKSVIIGTMFLGRIGPLAIGVSAVHRRRHSRVRFPEERIMIG